LRHPAAIPEDRVLEQLAWRDHLRAVAVQQERQRIGRHASGNPAEDQDQLFGPPLDTVQVHAGEGVKNLFTVAAAVIRLRHAARPVDPHPVGLGPRGQVSSSGCNHATRFVQ
jgi:hypothetical protein